MEWGRGHGAGGISLLACGLSGRHAAANPRALRAPTNSLAAWQGADYHTHGHPGIPPATMFDGRQRVIPWH